MPLNLHVVPLILFYLNLSALHFGGTSSLFAGIAYLAWLGKASLVRAGEPIWLA